MEDAFCKRCKRRLRAAKAQAKSSIKIRGGECSGIVLIAYDGCAYRRSVPDGEWTKLAPFKEEHGPARLAAVVSGKLYLLVGRNGNTLIRYDQHKWEKIENMPTPRSDGAAAASLGGTLYVSGGRHPDFFRAMNEVERFLPESNAWEKVAPMNMPRHGHQLVAAGTFLYAIGGATTGDVLTDTVERFNPDVPGGGRWEFVERMTVARINHSAISMGDNAQIYVVGGLVNENRLEIPTQRCERYSPAENKWTELQQPPERRESWALTRHENMIYLMGAALVAMDGQPFTSSYAPQCLDTETGEWKVLVHDGMPAIEYRNLMWVAEVD